MHDEANGVEHRNASEELEEIVEFLEMAVIEGGGAHASPPPIPHDARRR